MDEKFRDDPLDRSITDEMHDGLLFLIEENKRLLSEISALKTEREKLLNEISAELVASGVPADYARIACGILAEHRQRAYLAGYANGFNRPRAGKE